MGSEKKRKMREGKTPGKPANPDANVVRIEPVGSLPHGTKYCDHSALLTMAILNHSFNHRKRNL